ncbi:MAG: hypothetical protein V1778_02475 [bacterium]
MTNNTTLSQEQDVRRRFAQETRSRQEMRPAAPAQSPAPPLKQHNPVLATAAQQQEASRSNVQERRSLADPGGYQSGSSMGMRGVQSGVGSQLNTGVQPNMTGAIPGSAGTPLPAVAGAGALQKLSGAAPMAGAGLAGAAVAQGIGFWQDVMEIVGTSITVVGLLYAIPRLHYRLIFGNGFHGMYLPAKPMSMPGVWILIALMVDFLIAVLLLIVGFLLYVATHPCEVFIHVVIPSIFDSLKPTMQQLCPNNLIVP